MCDFKWGYYWKINVINSVNRDRVIGFSVSPVQARVTPGFFCVSEQAFLYVGELPSLQEL